MDIRLLCRPKKRTRRMQEFPVADIHINVDFEKALESEMTLALRWTCEDGLTAETQAEDTSGDVYWFAQTNRFYVPIGDSETTSPAQAIQFANECDLLENTGDATIPIAHSVAFEAKKSLFHEHRTKKKNQHSDVDGSALTYAEELAQRILLTESRYYLEIGAPLLLEKIPASLQEFDENYDISVNTQIVNSRIVENMSNKDVYDGNFFSPHKILFLYNPTGYLETVTENFSVDLDIEYTRDDSLKLEIINHGVMRNSIQEPSPRLTFISMFRNYTKLVLNKNGTAKKLCSPQLYDMIKQLSHIAKDNEVNEITAEFEDHLMNFIREMNDVLCDWEMNVFEENLDYQITLLQIIRAYCAHKTEERVTLPNFHGS